MLTEFSNAIADAVAAAAPSLVQVRGGRRPATGLVYAENTILTTTKALGREEGLQVRRDDGAAFDAELAGWDPASGLAVVHVAGLAAPSAATAAGPPRVGHVVIALARSWSNAITASAGIVSVIGGPLRTSRRGVIEQIIRTDARMHDGFAGGALIDTAGGVLGVATAASIRGLGVVIPSAIAWKTASDLLEHGRIRRGYLGIAGQRVLLGTPADGEEDETGVLVIAVTRDSPAAAAGVIVGDIVRALDGQPVTSPDDLLDLLSGERVGRTVALRISRGGKGVDLSVAIAERRAE